MTRAAQSSVPGLSVLVGLVVIGLLAGAGFYRWQRARSDQRVDHELAAAPRTPEERLELWLRLAGPQLHHRLAVVGRFTPEEPWLVTHARDDGTGTELFGVPCAELRPDFARREGMTIVLALPAPRALGRVPLVGPRAQRVPTFAPDVPVDAAALLRALAVHLLEDMPAALARDLPGASLAIEVDGVRQD